MRLVHHRAHIALVVLARPVHIEILQPRNPVQHPVAQRPQIEQLLAHPVHVQRHQRRRHLVRIRIPLVPVAIGRRARRIDEPRPPLQASTRTARAYTGNCCPADSPHPFPSCGCTPPDDTPPSSAAPGPPGAARESGSMDQISLELQPAQVLPALVRAQVIDNPQALFAAAVQFRHHVSPDESGRAGYDGPRLLVHSKSPFKPEPYHPAAPPIKPQSRTPNPLSPRTSRSVFDSLQPVPSGTAMASSAPRSASAATTNPNRLPVRENRPCAPVRLLAA